MSMEIEIKPTNDFVNVPHDITVLSTSIYGKYLGWKGVLFELLFFFIRYS
jgi:hypothetical protein